MYSIWKSNSSLNKLAANSHTLLGDLRFISSVCRTHRSTQICGQKAARSLENGRSGDESLEPTGSPDTSSQSASIMNFKAITPASINSSGIMGPKPAQLTTTIAMNRKASLHRFLEKRKARIEKQSHSNSNNNLESIK